MAHELQLPQLDEQPSLGGKLVHHAVTLTLFGVAGVLSVALVVLFAYRVEVTVEAPGMLEPQTVWRVHSPASGLVEEVLVETGDGVDEGQLLALLDGLAIENRLERLRLEAKHRRNDPQTRRSEREYLDQQIHALEREQRRLQVLSPAVGVILTEELEYLPGSRVNEGDLLFEVVTLDEWKAVLLVPERDIHTIRIGDPVKIRIPAATSLSSWITENFPGTVSFVGSDPMDRAASGKGTYRVFATLASERIEAEQLARFKRGMSVEGRVITRSARAVDLLIRYLRRRLGIGE